MTDAVLSPSRPLSEPRVSWKRVLIPSEHGGWGFLFEPILLGLLVAPSWIGLALGLAAVSAFLVRHPLKLALADRRRGKRYPRTVVAEKLALGLGVLAALLLAAVMLASPALRPLLLLGMPLALVQVIYDARFQSREIAPELAGAAALGLTAPAMALAAGWPMAHALGLWLLLLARAVPSILYVRVLVQRLHREPAGAWPAVAAHLLALASVAVAASRGLLPAAALFVPVLLLARAIHGLTRPPLTAKRLGWGEITYGATAVGIGALAYF